MVVSGRECAEGKRAVDRDVVDASTRSGKHQALSSSIRDGSGPTRAHMFVLEFPPATAGGRVRPSRQSPSPFHALQVLEAEMKHGKGQTDVRCHLHDGLGLSNLQIWLSSQLP